MARLKQSNEESTARLKQELKQELKQSNEESTARLKGELTKSTDRLQEYLNETSRELSDKIESSKVEMQEKLVGLSNKIADNCKRLEEHIQESREEKARMRHDIPDLFERLDSVNILVVNEIQKNNDMLRDEFSMQTETVRRELLESIKEVSTKPGEISSIDNVELETLTHQVEKDHTEIENMKFLITEICSNLETAKDNNIDEGTERSHREHSEESILANRVSNTEMRIQEITKRLSELDNNENISGSRGNNIIRDNSRIEFASTDDNNMNKAITASQSDATPSLPAKQNPTISLAECLDDITTNSNVASRFPVFKPGGELHHIIIIKAFETSLSPKWSNEKRIQFVIGHLEAEAAEWAVLHRIEFRDWDDFVKQFKQNYRSRGKQQHLTLELLDPPPYSKRWRAELKQSNEESTARLKEELKQELKQSNEESTARLKQSNEESMARLKQSNEESMARLKQSNEESMARLKQSNEESTARLKQELKQELKQSNEESTARLKGELTKSTDRLQEYLNETSRELSDKIESSKVEMQEKLVGLSNKIADNCKRLEEHIQESREEKARMRHDIPDLFERLDSVNILVVNEIQKNNDMLRDEFSMQTETVRRELLESIKEVSTKPGEISSIDNVELETLTHQVEKDHTEIENMKFLITEICSNLETAKDNNIDEGTERSHREHSEESILANRVSNTEMRIQEITKRLSELDNNENISGSRGNNIIRDNSRIEFASTDDNNMNKAITASQSDATPSLPAKQNPTISLAECLDDITTNSNVASRFPVFKPGGELHHIIIIKAFETSLSPKWSNEKRIQFVIGHLEAEAAEWAVLHRIEFRDWDDFVKQFKQNYRSRGKQQHLTLELLDPPPYSKRWRAELKQSNEESTARLKEELKQELKQSNEESTARLKQSNEESMARLKQSNEESMARLKQSNEESMARLKQSNEESTARLKQELKQELKQSNEESTARLKGELTKSTDRLQEYLNETSRELSDKIESSKVEMQEKLVGLSNKIADNCKRLEEHIQESREEKARMRHDIPDLFERLDSVNILVVNEIQKNNDMLRDEFSMQTETVRRELLESIKEVSTKPGEISSIDNVELETLTHQVEKDHTEIENMKFLITEICSNLETAKDNNIDEGTERSHREHSEESILANRVSNTEMRIQEITKRLSELDNNENISGSRGNNIIRDNSRIEFASTDDNNMNKAITASQSDATPSLPAKQNPTISLAECLDDITTNSNVASRFPVFKPGGELHHIIIIKAFETSLSPKWSNEKRIQFVIGHLEAEAAEWAVLHRIEFRDWDDFVKQFKQNYRSRGKQQHLTLELLDPPPYSKRWRAELKQSNEESTARLKEELKQELKQSNEESTARLKQSNEESMARLKQSNEESMARLKQSNEESMARLKQSNEESTARLKQELKQELKQSNEESTARLKGELTKSTDRLQEYLNETSRELSDKIESSKVEMQEKLVGLSNKIADNCKRLEEHIQESREEKARMRHDIPDLFERLDSVNILVVNEIQKNNDMLRDEFSMQTETVRRELLESIKEVSTKPGEISSIDNVELETLTHQVEKDHTEIENMKFLITEICSNLETAKDNNIDEGTERSHREHSEESILANRVSNTEMRIQEITKRLSELDNNENISGSRGNNIIRDNSRIEFASTDDNNMNKAITASQSDATPSLPAKQNPTISLAECLDDITTNSNVASRFPVFKPGGELHHIIIIKAFETSLSPKWSNEKRIQFVIGHLEAEAAEWAVLHRIEFRDWDDFVKQFKQNYRSRGKQQHLTLELLDPPPYSKRWRGNRYARAASKLGIHSEMSTGDRRWSQCKTRAPVLTVQQLV
ncbi:repetitive organellar protein-like [Schistocerca americana]|uniref:repetitive organellar protein-like n=1 Tax=Schistocerca americana TaxID=7009 RepID=UPI001F4FC70C|nr:repetitive organellar protein-like [Schistocerca americana]